MLDAIGWLLPSIKEPTWTDILIAISIIFLGFIIQRFILKPSIKKFAHFFKGSGRIITGDIIGEFSPAIRYAFLTIVIFLSFSILLEENLYVHKSTGNLFVSFMFFFAFKGVYDVLTFYLKNPEHFETGKDQDLLKPFFLRISKVFVMVIALFSIASLWNFNLNGFLTGIGLTGVAIAFGIRDTLGHLFSGMSVALDKPFQIGDWIATEDQKIDGVVEDINLRSTLIQTGEKGLVYVPNSYLVNRPIYNLSKRTKRKVEQYFYVSTGNSEEILRAACEKIREQIALHPDTEKDIIHVNIDDYRSGSFRLIVRFFVLTNDSGIMLNVKQDILFVIKQIFDELSVEIIESQPDLWVHQIEEKM
ncbi:mechanosensitive ion channel family protein [Lysinibacillus sp. 54212]|uniref:mechanosensitive ion channel family protein n=1 Tax=Lysinibacillus sp. 54212 TaxID=3119829 RepID=UPI002FC7FA37